jgi:hypothetical protein
MADFFHILLVGFRLSMFVGAAGVVFSVGVIWVCKCLKWAPVNITIHNYPPPQASAEPDGSET